MGASRVDRLLQRVVLVLVALLLALLCLLVWQVVGMAGVLSADARQISATVVRLSENVEELADRVDEMRASTREAMDPEYAAAFLDEFGSLGPQLAEGTGPGTEDVEAEIDHLLQVVRESELRFRFGRREVEAAAFYLQLWAKYQSLQRAIETTDAFLDHVADRTLIGQRYYVLKADDDKQLLREWLEQQLDDYRQGEAEPAGS